MPVCTAFMRTENYINIYKGITNLPTY